VSPLPHVPPDHSCRILEQVASRTPISQRTLARDTGIALGLANLLVRRMVADGWLQMIRVGPNRVRYLITPAGLAERDRRRRAHLAGSVRYYAEARDRISERFATLSAEWQPDARGSGEKRIVFCCAGEVAEIGYVCLQRTDLVLVGVVDAAPGHSFFGVPVSPFEALAPGRIGDVPFDRLVITSFDDQAAISRLLDARGLRGASVFWL
jgi:hypothetical protein